MLQKFEIVRAGGTPLYTYDRNIKENKSHDSSSILMSGFMEAIQMMSESFGSGSLETIKFSDMYIYVKTYGDFSIRMITDEKMEEDTLNTIFTRTSTQTVRVIAEHGESQIIESHAFDPVIKPIIDPYTSDFWKKNLSLLEDMEVPPKKASSSATILSKIALVGLAKAGKTSIKNKFFHSWSDTMIEDIKATVGIDITNKFESFIEERFLIMDFAGQQTYRKQHLEDTAAWKGISLLLFVLDLQKGEDDFKKARSYLDRVWKIVKEVNENEPRLAIFLHKYDPKKRTELEKNIATCMSIFIDYKDRATFHLTSIYDQTSNDELIKSIFLLLPDVIIKKMMEERFLDHFDDKVLPTFQPIMNKDYEEQEFRKIKERIHKNAVIMGKDYGTSIQKSWLKYITGNWSPKERRLSAKKAFVTRENQTLKVSFDDFKNIADNKKQFFVSLLLDGILTGISNVLHLPNPEREGNKMTWTFKLK